MTLGFKQTIIGKPNYFIEKIWTGLDPMISPDYYFFNEEHVKKFGKHWDGAWTDDTETNFNPKLHTIREDKHNRWKPGMKIHPVINNRTPNRFQFAPVLECKSVQKIEIKWRRKGKHLYVKVFIDGKVVPGILHKLAPNDGFDSIDAFLDYFNEDFTGKIIHWTNLKY